MRLCCRITTSTIVRIGIDIGTGPWRRILAPRRSGDWRVVLDGGNLLLEVARNPFVAGRSAVKAIHCGGAAFAAQRDHVPHLVLVDGRDDVSNPLPVDCGRPPRRRGNDASAVDLRRVSGPIHRHWVLP